MKKLRKTSLHECHLFCSSVVHLYCVLRKMMRSWKLFVTHRTCIRFVAGVDPLVSNQLLFCMEGLVTLITGVRFWASYYVGSTFMLWKKVVENILKINPEILPHQIFSSTCIMYEYIVNYVYLNNLKINNNLYFLTSF